MITKYYERVIDEYTKPYTPVKQTTVKFHKPLQDDLFNMGVLSGVRMGLFYELMTIALFGGELFDIAKKNGFKDYFYDKKIRPDVLDSINKLAFESKASKSGQQTNLIDRQINGYKLFQWDHPTFRFYYCFYRHNFNKVHSTDATMKEMYDYLAKNTSACITLPFSIILHLHEHPDLYRYGDKEKENKWVVCTRVGVKMLNQFYFDAEKHIEDVGLNPDDYIIEKYMVKDTIKIYEHQVESFPLLWIKDKNHSLWYSRFDEVPF